MGVWTHNAKVDNFFRLFAAIMSALGLVSIVVGVAALCLTLDNEGKKRDKGELCSDKKEMGYFVGERKGGCCGIIPCCNRWPKSKRPEVPTLTGLFQAGDALLYTSASLDHIPPSHREICWTPFYSAVLDQVVRDRQSLRVILRGAPKLKKALLMAEKCLPMSERGCIAKCLSKVLPFLLFRSEIVDVEFDPISLSNIGPNRHTLHKRHILVPCVRKLDIYTVGKLTPQDDLTYGLKKPRPVWVFDRQPSIEMDNVELAELSLIFGMKLYVRLAGSSSRVYGIGAFGTFLDGHIENGVWRIRIIHGNRDIIEGTSKGSGYSTLHAKYIACGCLPFGQKDGWIQYVQLNSSVRYAIRNGQDICNGPPTPPDDAAACQANSFLRKLSKIGSFSCYNRSSARGRTAEDVYGRFFEKRGPNWEVVKMKGVVASWSRAVAYVPFGGLVPQAADILADAIKFTLFGYAAVRGQDILQVAETLEKIANKVHLTNKDEYLFGPSVPFRLEHSTTNQLYALMNSVRWDVRLAAATFSRYMTLIEYFVAQYNITITDIPDPTERKAMQTKLKGGGPSHRRDIAFEALSNSLEVSHRNAVKLYDANFAFNIRSNAVTRMHENIQHPGFVPSLADVTTLLECVIAVWAEFVPRIVVKVSNDQSHTFPFENIWNNNTEVGFDLDWTDDKTHHEAEDHPHGEGHHDTEKHHEYMNLSHFTRKPEQEVYHAPALEDLPSIAAFG